MIAKENLEERYPDRKILIVDSLGASSGYGLLMDKLADLRDEEKSLDEVFRYAEKHRLNVHHWFFSTDLTFYVTFLTPNATKMPEQLPILWNPASHI